MLLTTFEADTCETSRSSVTQVVPPEKDVSGIFSPVWGEAGSNVHGPHWTAKTWVALLVWRYLSYKYYGLMCVMRCSLCQGSSQVATSFATLEEIMR